MTNEPNQKIIVPISQSELEDLMRGEDFNWTFPTGSGELIDVHLELEEDGDMDEDDDS